MCVTSAHTSSRRPSIPPGPFRGIDIAARCAAPSCAPPVLWLVRTEPLGVFGPQTPAESTCRPLNTMYSSIPATRFSQDRCHIPAPGPSPPCPHLRLPPFTGCMSRRGCHAVGHAAYPSLTCCSRPSCSSLKESRARVAVLAPSHARLSVQLVHVLELYSATLSCFPVVTSRPSQISRRIGAISGEAS